MDLFVLALTVLALLLAVWQLWLAAKQMRDARAQAKDLNEIRSSLSTRFIGQFPDFVPEIVSLIKHANREVIICCDFPTYAYVSDHSVWREYRFAIEERLDKGVRVSLTMQNKDYRSRLNREQYNKTGEVEWKKWITENANRLQKFLPAHIGNTKIDDLTRDNFLDILEAADQQMLRETFARAEVNEVATSIPLLFWIIDGKQAIFSFAPISENIVEYGFFTLDQRLIAAFQEVRNRYNRM